MIDFADRTRRWLASSEFRCRFCGRGFRHEGPHAKHESACREDLTPEKVLGGIPALYHVLELEERNVMVQNLAPAQRAKGWRDRGMALTARLRAWQLEIDREKKGGGYLAHT